MINNIGEFFHKLTKKNISNSIFNHDSKEDKKDGIYFYKNYDRFRKIKLPGPSTFLDCDIADAMKNHELDKKFSGESVTLSELSDLIFYAFGITRKALTSKLSRRAQISISGEYSLEIYILNYSIEDLQSNVYHYNINGHYLESLWPNNELHNVQNHLFPKYSISGASCAILITAQPLNTVSRFNSVGYRYIYFEAGAVAQNLNIIANTQKLSLTVVEEIDEEAIEKFLDIGGEQETIILTFFLGKI